MSWSSKTRRSSPQEEPWGERGEEGTRQGQKHRDGLGEEQGGLLERVGGREEVRAGRSVRSWILGVLLDQGGQFALDLSAMEDP